MTFTENDIIDILKEFKCENPTKFLMNWKNNKSNIPPDHDYPYFIFTFPIIIDDVDVADLTIFENGHHFDMNKLMSKYMGHEKWERSYLTFNHDNYRHYCLTVNKEFKFTSPYISNFKDVDGKDIKYGLLTLEDYELKKSRLPNSNHIKFHDCHLVIGIENKSISGYELSKKINSNILLNTNLKILKLKIFSNHMLLIIIEN